MSILGEPPSDVDMLLMIVLTCVMFVSSIVLTYIVPAPYGKFSDKGSKIPLTNIKVVKDNKQIDGRYGFCVQECPSVFIPLIVFYYYRSEVSNTSILFLVLWEIHYIHR